MARIPRPGLTDLYELHQEDEDPPGPVLRMFQNPGLFRGDLFTIAAGELYRNDEFVSTLAYSLQPRMVASLTQLAIVSGGALYVYENDTLTLVEDFADVDDRLPPFSSVAVLFNIFVYSVVGSNQFYFSETGDATQINAASFANAETSPDPIVEIATLAEELYFFGSTSVEIWNYTGVLALPFKLSEGRTYIRGCAAQGSVVKLDNALFWIGDDLTVYRSGPVPVRVSTSYIEDRLREGATSPERITAFCLGIEGHWFYVVNLPAIDQSYAYDCQTQEWAQWGTQDPFAAEPGLLAASCSVGQGETIYAGSATDSRIWLWDASNNTDDGTAKRVIISGAIWTTAGRLRLNSVGLQCVRGVGNADAPDPVVEMRMSKDGGRTWGSWLAASLGMVGQYTVKAVWRGLGMVSQPGVLFEWSVSDPVMFVTEGAAYNEERY